MPVKFVAKANCDPAAAVVPGSIAGRIGGTGNVYIGRVGFDIAITCPNTWDLAGDTVTISGLLNPATLADALTLREQLNNLAGNVDEPVVPIVWGAEPTRNGYYRIESVRITGDDAWLGFGEFEFAIDATRMQDYRSPLLVSQKYGDRRSAFHTGVTASDQTWRHSLNVYARGFSPATQVGAWRSADIATYAPAAAVSEAAPMVLRKVTQANAVNEHTYRMPPDNYYAGAATLLTGSAATTTHGVAPSFLTGYKIVNGQNNLILPRRWVLSNGLIRIWPDPVDGRFHVQTFITGSGWEGGDGTITTGPKSFQIRNRIAGVSLVLGAATGDATDWSACSILRNGPEECSIRLLAAYIETGVGSATRDEPHTVDLILRRGMRHVSMQIFSHSVGATAVYDLESVPTETATFTSSYYMRGSANDPSGNRLVFTSSRNLTAVGSFLRATGGAGSAYADFGYGIEANGSSSVSPDTALDIAVEHYDGSPEFTAFGRA